MHDTGPDRRYCVKRIASQSGSKETLLKRLLGGVFGRAGNIHRLSTTLELYTEDCYFTEYEVLVEDATTDSGTVGPP